MSAPSSRRDLARALLLALLVAGGLGGAGCGAKGAEGDPAAFAALANRMIDNIPVPGVAACSGPQVLGGATITMRTLVQIADRRLEDRHELKEFVNPPQLDVPAARVLADPKAGADARRRAAAELALAPFYLVYLIDIVDVPMALEIKELKLGVASGRALRYDRNGNLECARPFLWHNDKAVSDEAIAKSKKAIIDPAVAQRLREDLTAQLLARIAALGAPPPVATEMAKKPEVQ